MFTKLMNKKIISAIILIFSIVGVILSIVNFRMLKNPSNICDCKTQDKLYFISRLLSSDSASSSRIYRRQQMRACIYNYIYKSKTYDECAAFPGLAFHLNSAAVGLYDFFN